jgi:hypothetical protein
MAYARGSGFVGLTNYLGLNRQAGERMGEQLAQQVEGSTAAARGAVDAASADFAQRSAAGMPGAMPYGLDAAERDAWLSAPPTYTGPKQIGDVADLSAIEAKLATAERQGRLASTDYGRTALMGGTGSQGGRMLDAALAGRGGGVRLDQAAKGYQGLRDYLGLAKTGAAGLAATGEQKAGAMRNDYATELATLRTPNPTTGGYGPSLAEKQRQEQLAAMERQRRGPQIIGTHPGAGSRGGGSKGERVDTSSEYVVIGGKRVRNPNYKG